MGQGDLADLNLLFALKLRPVSLVVGLDFSWAYFRGRPADLAHHVFEDDTIFDEFAVRQGRRPRAPQGGDKAISVAGEISADGFLDIRVDVHRR